MLRGQNFILVTEVVDKYEQPMGQALFYLPKLHYSESEGRGANQVLSNEFSKLSHYKYLLPLKLS